MNVRNDARAKGNKRILTGDKMSLIRGKITHDARDIFWLTVVSDGSPSEVLPVVYE
jgi:hypothetical protein